MLSIGVVFNMITASMRTEELLESSRARTWSSRSGRTSSRRGPARGSRTARSRRPPQAWKRRRSSSRWCRVQVEFLEHVARAADAAQQPLILAKLLAENDEQTLTLRQVEYARTIHSAGNDLLALISQILDLSKIEAGKLQIETHPVAIVDICDYVDGTFRQVAAQKDVAFEVRTGPSAPKVVHTDLQRLQQILKNLLSNALKFTAKGQVQLTIDQAPSSVQFTSDILRRAREIVAFTVSDTGIGIAEGKQQLIFEAFQQADASTSRMYGGTGLGLTISRELAHLLGGGISVVSAPGVGSNFTLYLPADGPGPVTISGFQDAGGETVSTLQVIPEPPVEEQSTEGLERRKVLLVDDDARNLFAVTSLLERCEMVVISATSAPRTPGAEGAPDVDLVLMDIMLPGMDGYQATGPSARCRRTRGSRSSRSPRRRCRRSRKCIEAPQCLRAKPVDSNRLVWR
jgi:signal transduction histidine kinase